MLNSCRQRKSLIDVLPVTCSKMATWQRSDASAINGLYISSVCCQQQPLNSRVSMVQSVGAAAATSSRRKYYVTFNDVLYVIHRSIFFLQCRCTINCYLLLLMLAGWGVMRVSAVSFSFPIRTCSMQVSRARGESGEIKAIHHKWRVPGSGEQATRTQPRMIRQYITTAQTSRVAYARQQAPAVLIYKYNATAKTIKFIRKKKDELRTLT